MSEMILTRKTGTETDEGWIPHKRYRNSFLPVCLDFKSDLKMGDYQKPLKNKGKLVYALPGGQKITL